MQRLWRHFATHRIPPIIQEINKRTKKIRISSTQFPSPPPKTCCGRMILLQKLELIQKKKRHQRRRRIDENWIIFYIDVFFVGVVRRWDGSGLNAGLWGIVSGLLEGFSSNGFGTLNGCALWTIWRRRSISSSLCCSFSRTCSWTMKKI